MIALARRFTNRHATLGPDCAGDHEAGYLHFDYDDYGKADGIAFVNTLKRYGWKWGGDWTRKLRSTRRLFAHKGERVRLGRVDPMHFELEISQADARRKGSLGRLRAYRLRHPFYMAAVLKAEKARDCRHLQSLWRAGEA